MRILQINSTVNTGSTGRIAEEIGQVLMAHGHESFIAYGRGNQTSKSNLIKIGTSIDLFFHGIQSAIFDRHGFGSTMATKKLIAQIEEIKPDAIGLHNLHGYYLNVRVLFDYIAEKKIPIVWTLHECWTFTGHCAFFDFEYSSCQKWKTQCESCPKTRKYPTSFLIDNSKNNYLNKKQIFNQIDNCTIVTPSKWLKNIVEESFLNHPVLNIPNGVNLQVFKYTENVSEVKKKYKITTEKVVLGVANIWDKRKGLNDFIKLQSSSKKNYQIVLVGLSEKQIKELPSGIIGIKRTENVEELASLYSLAHVFVNPTYQDNFPTTNIEALACGTPIVTYNTGGSPEAIDEKTGIVVEKGNFKALEIAIHSILQSDKRDYIETCRRRAEEYFDKDYRFMDYLNLYEKVLNINRQ